LFVWHEQGLGDVIQMIRYAPRLIEMGFALTWEAPPALLPLLATVAADFALVPTGQKIPMPFDLHCPIMSLPFATGTTAQTIPASDAYLHASREKEIAWGQRLGKARGMRVGLAWSGSPTHRKAILDTSPATGSWTIVTHCRISRIRQRWYSKWI
jgi:hypothetical protein